MIELQNTFPLTPAQAGVRTYSPNNSHLRPYPCLRRDERSVRNYLITGQTP